MSDISVTKRQAVKIVKELFNIGPPPPAMPDNAEQMNFLREWERKNDMCIALVDTLTTLVDQTAEETVEIALQNFKHSADNRNY